MPMLALIAPARVDALIRRTTRVTPNSEAERIKRKADTNLAIGVGALRAYAASLDLTARRSHCSWATLNAAFVALEAAQKFEQAVLVDTEMAP